MARAFLNLRYNVPERTEAFTRGLERLGYSVVNIDGVAASARPKTQADILVTWNRHVDGGIAADRFESQGNRVLVAENATWGNGFQGEHWYTVARRYHNLSGCFFVGGNERWDALDVQLQPFRLPSGYPETVVLASRGIGPARTRQPAGWLVDAKRMAHPARVRPHPGKGEHVMALEHDLSKAWCVLTWGSGAAVLALMWGCSVLSGLPGWIGEQDNTEEGRLAMFRRLAWAQWRLKEIRNGECFARLLGD